jgi:hypothetical protein
MAALKHFKVSLRGPVSAGTDVVLLLRARSFPKFSAKKSALIEWLVAETRGERPCDKKVNAHAGPRNLPAGALRQARLSGHHACRAEGLFRPIANVGMAQQSVPERV